jgi:hypothetical protein
VTKREIDLFCGAPSFTSFSRAAAQNTQIPAFAEGYTKGASQKYNFPEYQYRIGILPYLVAV